MIVKSLSNVLCDFFCLPAACSGESVEGFCAPTGAQNPSTLSRRLRLLSALVGTYNLKEEQAYVDSEDRKGANEMAEEDVNEQQQGMVSRFGPIQIDWPRTIGYYGGIGLATAFELIEPPLALFIAAIPLLKMLNHP